MSFKSAKHVWHSSFGTLELPVFYAVKRCFLVKGAKPKELALFLELD